MRYRAVDEMKTVARFRCQRVENLLPDPASRPPVEAVVSRRVGSIALRQISPRHPGSQHVKDRVHDLAILGTCALAASGHQWLQQSPFLLAQIKPHDSPPTTVNHDYPIFSRHYVSTDPSLPFSNSFDSSPKYQTLPYRRPSDMA